MAAERLQVEAGECLVLEDSPNGVRAGIAADMNVIAVATPFTSAGLESSHVVEDSWIVRDPSTLLDVVERPIEEHNRTAH